MDWGIEHEFIFNWKDGKPRIYDGGDVPFSTTTVGSVGVAVVGVLSHPEETKNRNVYIQDVTITQNQLLAIAQKAAPEKKFEPVHLKATEVEKSSYDALANGDYSPGVFVGFLLASIFGKGFGQPFEKNDNELLGVPGKTEEDILAIFKKAFASEN